MERFARRKEEYSLALAMHTASTVTKMAVDVESINYKCVFYMDDHGGRDSHAAGSS